MFDELNQGLYLAVVFSALPLLASLFVGIAISVFQAATQIQESTISFVPKLAVVLACLYFFSPYLLSQILDYTRRIIESLAYIS